MELKSFTTTVTAVEKIEDICRGLLEAVDLLAHRVFAALRAIDL